MKRLLYLALSSCLFILNYSVSNAQVWGEGGSRTDYRDNAGAQGTEGAVSGFFQTVNPINYPAGASSWWHLLDVRHSNPNNNFAMQFAGSFWDQQLWFRKTGNNPAQPWSKVVLEKDGIVQVSNLRSDAWQPLGSVSDDFYVDVEPGTRVLRTRNYNLASPNVAATGIHTGSGEFEGPVTVKGKGRIEDNLKIYASSEAWAEGICIIKPTGWSGIRIARNDPTNGNFDGNWALGYNANTGNDFSISSNYGAAQYDNIFHISASNRNIGIGTSTPDSKLTVKGKIHAEEVKVDLAVPGPDYVFDKEYALKSLPETEKYISENKHLPEIPSAKAMKEEGLNMGEMQMKLLQKIEELTLHLIELDKKISAVQEENKELKAQAKSNK